ncbi:MAG: hypothetical protein ACYTFI_21925 [Planctomycetota bacterium]
MALVLSGAGCERKDTMSDMATDNSQEGWRVKSSTVEMFVTRNGGHMAPVSFCTDGKPVQPYYISPWQNDGLRNLPDPVLVPLRGDFFCMPFGGNAEAYEGEKYTGHGETSSSKWSLVSNDSVGGVTTLTLELNTKIRKGKVTKKLALVDGENAVYSSHVIEGFTGRMPLGHHCTLDVPEEEGSLRVAVSAFDLGMTCPVIFSNPKNREYQSLAVNEKFTDLTNVPVMAKGEPPADCTSFPEREGYSDLIQIFRKPSTDPAWTTVTCQKKGYLWFALKDAAVLPGTVFWISNKGRHGSPWDGRNRCLGMEENCAYFAEGIVPSLKPNVINEAGFPTAVEFSGSAPTVVNLIQGAIRIPDGFEMVKDVTFAPGKVTFTATTGKSVTADVRHGFVKTGKL